MLSLYLFWRIDWHGKEKKIKRSKLCGWTWKKKPNIKILCALLEMFFDRSKNINCFSFHFKAIRAILRVMLKHDFSSSSIINILLFQNMVMLLVLFSLFFIYFQICNLWNLNNWQMRACELRIEMNIKLFFFFLKSNIFSWWVSQYVHLLSLRWKKKLNEFIHVINDEWNTS